MHALKGCCVLVGLVILVFCFCMCLYVDQIHPHHDDIPARAAVEIDRAAGPMSQIEAQRAYDAHRPFPAVPRSVDRANPENFGR